MEMPSLPRPPKSILSFPPPPPGGSGRSEPPHPILVLGGGINTRHCLITAAMVELSGLRRLSTAPMAGGQRGGGGGGAPPLLGDRPPSAPTAPRHRPHPPRAHAPRPGPRSIRSLHQSHASVPPLELSYWLSLLGPILIRWSCPISADARCAGHRLLPARGTLGVAVRRRRYRAAPLPLRTTNPRMPRAAPGGTLGKVAGQEEAQSGRG